MSLFSRFFYRRPPNGLLEFVERVYVFDSCFSTEVLSDGMYQIYLREIITELHEEFAYSSFLALNFREGVKRSQFAEVLCEYDVTVIDYPRQYEGCPLLPLSLIQHFLRVSDAWLSLENHQNIILIHCDRGGWPLLAFLLASFLIFRKLQSGEQKTLEIVYREAPRGFLQLLSPLNPFPSQLRYLQYVARRNISPEWPPPERALSLDCLILRGIPSFDSDNGCRPTVRIFGRNLHSKGGLSTNMLFSMPKKKKSVWHYRQADCDVIKIDIQCLVQGDVVLECLHVDLDPAREVMMFRIMFNTAFIRSNILMLNCEDIDILWDSKDRYPKGFRAEVLFGETESISPRRAPTATLNGEEKGGLPVEAFSRVQEFFDGVEWADTGDAAALWLLRQISANALQEKLEKLILNDVKELTMLQSKVGRKKYVASPTDSDEEKESEMSDVLDSLDTAKVQHVANRSLGVNGLENLPSATSFEGNEDPVLTSKSDAPLSLAFIDKQRVNIPPPPAPPELSPLLHAKSCRAPPPPPPPPLNLLSDRSAPSSLARIIQPPAPPPAPLPPVHNKAPPPPPAPPLLRAATTSNRGLPSPPPPPPPSFQNMTSKAPPPPPPPPLPPAPTTSSRHPPPSPPPPPPPSLITSRKGASSPSLPSAMHARSPPSPPPPPVITSSRGPPPPPPPPPAFIKGPPPPPPPPPSVTTSGRSPPPPPPPLPTSNKGPPPPPPPPTISNKGPPPPPPPPVGANHVGRNDAYGAPPPPPSQPPPSVPARKGPAPSPPPPPPPQTSKQPNSVPPPPPFHGGSHGNIPGPPQPPGVKASGGPAPPPPLIGRGRGLASNSGRGRGAMPATNAPKRTSLKPLHWVKVTRAMQGSLWADPQKQENQLRPPEIDISEIENLFSVAVASESSGADKGGPRRGSNSNKPETVHLVDMRRAYNCEIMLTKIKMPLPEMMSAILALDTTILDIDQVENLIKFCPTKEEVEMLKNYPGNKDVLGRCEQFFLELMIVPRVESKLRVFSFRMTFSMQVNDLRSNLSTINYASIEVKGSTKLRQIMQTILTLGNVLNQGTARGSAVGFKLDSLLKLSDIRARKNNMTLMHYLCKLIAEKMPELLDFDKDLIHLEAASKIQLKILAEEMQAVSKGLEKVDQELTASEGDGAVSTGFRKALKEFLDAAEADVRPLAALYSEVGRSADSLAQYFGEDPARCPFEQVTSILVIFVNMFNKAREENARQAEAEKKKLEKEASKEKVNSSEKIVDSEGSRFSSLKKKQ